MKGRNDNQVVTTNANIGLDPNGLANNGGPTPTVAIVAAEHHAPCYNY